ALARARTEDKPILLSIGYSACHWCHVMAHESFENPSIAAQMNEGFVCVKVDREERPDLDDIYMAATMAMNHGQGGWPMTVFLTPDQRPFFAGTYFPPEDRHGRPGFPAILRRIAELWRDNRTALERVGEELTTHLRQAGDSRPGTVDLDAAFARLLDQLTGTFDPHWGGFGRAPKFPPATLLRLLLILHRRGHDGRALQMVRRTLDGMARGGMYDQIGGGFSRYSTDDQWLVPHFEKMLYDNALLARAYLEGYQVTGDAFYRTIAADVLDYILREMTAPEGGFHSATDADSEGVEGKFFVWTRAEFEAVLGPEAALAAAWFDVTEMGNWEGQSIPRTPRMLADVAADFGIDADEAATRLASARQLLYAARLRRVPPGLDDKVLTSWNGLMIGAMAEGARVLGEPRYLEGAVRAADFALAQLRGPDGRLLRSWRRGTAHLNAYLEDYAFLGNGLLDLYEAGGEERYLMAAQALAARILDDFAAPDGGFFSTSADHEALLVRHREGHDGAVP
ncbi:MAG TPA: thioredoxin domain-containing protein, partial [Gemmatimonadales bacterium]|nr:thioredoxin domain-containing protein [Gemmatimonadales bacterium]